MTTVILPKLNEKDLVDVPAYALQGLTIQFASHVEEVFKYALQETGTPMSSHQAPQVIRSVEKKKRASKLTILCHSQAMKSGKIILRNQLYSNKN